jgi:hypothetical protein
VDEATWQAFLDYAVQTNPKLVRATSKLLANRFKSEAGSPAISGDRPSAIG